jgi:outer membrane receptor protein involved in Fe transport
VFAQDELDLGAWQVTLGARLGAFSFEFDDLATGDHEDGRFTAASGSAAVARELAPDRRVVATLARGFRAPNLAELARDATFFGGDELHNAELEPETSLYAELAFEQTLERGTLALAAFANRIDDVVGSRLIDAGGPDAGDETYLRENIGELHVLGAFARADLRLFGADSRWNLAPALEWTRAQQYSDFVDPFTGEQTFDDVPGQRIPPLHGQLALRHDTHAGAIGWVALTASFALEQDRLSPQDLGDPRIDPAGTDGWLTLDLDCGGELGRAGSHWFAGVHNLLDADYRVHGSGFDAPGIGAVAGLRIVR